MERRPQGGIYRSTLLSILVVSLVPRALLGWRLLALVYDFFPALALWMLLSSAFTLGYTFLGHHATRQNIAPFSALQWLLWLCCWAVTGAYATISWRRGGATLGILLPSSLICFHGNRWQLAHRDARLARAIRSR